MFSKTDGRVDRECSKKETAIMQRADASAMVLEKMDKDTDFSDFILIARSGSWSVLYIMVAPYGFTSQTMPGKTILFSYQFNAPQKEPCYHFRLPNEEEYPTQGNGDEYRSRNKRKEDVLKLDRKIEIISASTNRWPEGVIVKTS